MIKRIFLLLTINLCLISCSDPDEAAALDNINKRCTKVSEAVGASTFMIDICIKNQTKLYRQGKPSLAAHTNEELYKMKPKQPKDAKTERDIDKVCAEPEIMTSIVYDAKEKNKTKKETEELMREFINQLNNKKENIAQNTGAAFTWRAIDLAYDKGYTRNQAIIEINNQCRKMFSKLFYTKPNYR